VSKFGGGPYGAGKKDFKRGKKSPGYSERAMQGGIYRLVTGGRENISVVKMGRTLRENTLIHELYDIHGVQTWGIRCRGSFGGRSWKWGYRPAVKKKRTIEQKGMGMVLALTQKEKMIKVRKLSSSKK